MKYDQKLALRRCAENGHTWHVVEGVETCTDCGQERSCVTTGQGGYREDDPDDLVSCMDALEWLATLDAESVDLVITDLPYESMEKHRKRGTTTRLKHSDSSSNDWFKIFPNERFDELFGAFWRVLRQDTHCYMFCDHETLFHLRPSAEKAGFTYWKPIVWDKVRIGMGYHYRASYEFIVFFEKGKRRLNNLGIPDVLRDQGVDLDELVKLWGMELAVPRIHRGYPAEKPASLVETLVLQSTNRGDLVIDPFCGSGSTGVAAVSPGVERRFLGNDISIAMASVAEMHVYHASSGT